MKFIRKPRTKKTKDHPLEVQGEEMMVMLHPHLLFLAAVGNPSIIATLPLSVRPP